MISHNILNLNYLRILARVKKQVSRTIVKPQRRAFCAPLIYNTPSVNTIADAHPLSTYFHYKHYTIIIFDQLKTITIYFLCLSQNFCITTQNIQIVTVLNMSIIY